MADFASVRRMDHMSFRGGGIMDLDFIAQVRALAAQVSKQREVIRTEESTKNSLVLPFISALGYNVFDPTEVIPEFDANFGTKLNYKCDYAVFRDNKPIMLFECKWCGKELEKKDEDQLRQYFAACTDAKVAVVTNGILYRFFMDLEKEHVMDDKPFLEFDMTKIKPKLVEALKRFTKSAFDLDELINAASELKYTGEVMRILGQEFSDPSDEFVRFFAGRVHSGKFTQKIRDKFRGITEPALQQFINDQISDTLQDTLKKKTQPPDPTGPKGEVIVDSPPTAPLPTEEEKEAYHIVRAILCQSINPDRIRYRDLKKGFTMVLDDSTWKPICRLHFDEDPKEIGLLDENKAETRQAIQQPSDIYRFSEQLKATAIHYLTKPVTNGNHAEEPETPGE